AQRGVEELALNVTYALPHEFRTALNQILGSAQTLKTIATEDATVAEIAGDIIASAQRLLRITENFPVYAQLETLSADRRASEQLRLHRTEEAAAMAADIAMTKAEHYRRSTDLVTGAIPEGVTVAM